MASPAELLMSRTKLPSISNTLMPRLVKSNDNQRCRTKQIEKAKHSYNKNTKNLKPVVVGNEVYFKKNPLPVWLPGTIVDICREPRSYLIKDEQCITYRRNRQHILDTSKKFDDGAKEKIPEIGTANDNTPNVNKQTIRDSDKNYSKSGRKIKPPRRFGLED